MSRFIPGSAIPPTGFSFRKDFFTRRRKRARPFIACSFLPVYLSGIGLMILRWIIWAAITVIFAVVFWAFVWLD